jgi:hypothetical protein
VIDLVFFGSFPYFAGLNSIMRSQQDRRLILALGLLGVIALQWIAGGIYVKRSFLVVSSAEMSQTEYAIANQVFDEYGIQAQVNVVEEGEVSYLQSLGYAAPFVHSVEIDGHARMFTLNEQRIQLQAIEMDLTPCDQQTNPTELLNLHRLFNLFCFGETIWMDSDCVQYPDDNFHVSRWHDSFFNAMPSPPPRWV